MPLFDDRFLTDEEDGVIDLATGESVRLTVAASLPRENAQQRAEMCDRLFVLRHPLLVPLVDYGSVGAVWFEAHAVVPPLRVSAADARRAALHLLRFLQRAGVVLSGDAPGRHVRPALEGPSIGWRQRCHRFRRSPPPQARTVTSGSVSRASGRLDSPRSNWSRSSCVI